MQTGCPNPEPGRITVSPEASCGRWVSSDNETDWSLVWQPCCSSKTDSGRSGSDQRPSISDDQSIAREDGSVPVQFAGSFSSRQPAKECRFSRRARSYECSRPISLKVVGSRPPERRTAGCGIRVTRPARAGQPNRIRVEHAVERVAEKTFPPDHLRCSWLPLEERPGMKAACPTADVAMQRSQDEGGHEGRDSPTAPQDWEMRSASGILGFINRA